MAEPAPIDEWRFPNRATPPGSSAYYSVRFSPPGLRDTLAALFAWRGEVRGILDDVSDPGVARIKLDWWRDEIRRTLGGKPRHPLSIALAGGTRDLALPIDPFLDIAERVEDELRVRLCADAAALRAAEERDLGALFALIDRCHAQPGADSIDADGRAETARRAGGWCGQVRRIRDAGLLLRRSRQVLPENVLRGSDLSHEALASTRHRHRLPALLAPIAAGLQQERPSAADVRPLPAALRAQTRIHALLLDELVRVDLDVVDQRIGLTPLRKLWAAWRAAR